MNNTKHQTEFNKTIKCNRKDITVRVNRKFNGEFLLSSKLYTLFLRQLVAKE